MNDLLKGIIQGKLKQISEDELLTYGRQYGFQLSKQEAKQITQYLKTTHNDPFNRQDRKAMFLELEKITNERTAQKAEQLFSQIIQSYGVGHLFE